MSFRLIDRRADESGLRLFLKHRKMIVLFSLLIFSALCWFGQQQLLVIRSDGGHARTWRMAIGETWRIQYVHSVQKTPVEECFLVTGDSKLVLYETHYQSYGVGLPFLATDGVFEQKDGYFVLKLHRIFPQVKFRVGLEAKPEAVINGRIEPLYQYYQPGSLMIFTIEPRWRYYLKMIMNFWGEPI